MCSVLTYRTNSRIHLIVNLSISKARENGFLPGIGHNRLAHNQRGIGIDCLMPPVRFNLPFTIHSLTCSLRYLHLKAILKIARSEFSYFFHAIWKLTSVLYNFLKTVKLPDCAFNCLFHFPYFPTIQDRV